MLLQYPSILFFRPPLLDLPVLAVLEWKWLRTQNPIYKDLFKYWIKIFAVALVWGVVSGVVMSYQFGTNWSEFSRVAGSITGPLLTYEVLSAFFLEAGFLGIMLFGWGRVGLEPISLQRLWLPSEHVFPCSGFYLPIAGCKRRKVLPSKMALLCQKTG